MRIHKYLLIFSIILLGAGLTVIIPLGYSWYEQRQAVAAILEQPAISAGAPIESTTQPNAIQGVPTHISIPSLGIEAAVRNGYYDPHTGQWTLSEDSAYYATVSSPANSISGNTFIYGHNSQKIFGKLLFIQSNAEAIVITDNGYIFTYIFQSSHAVQPTDVTAALTYTEKPQLTLQTCSGLWHQTRQMVYFSLKSYKKI